MVHKPRFFFQRTQDIIACFVDPENGMVEANMDDFRVHLRNMGIKINNMWDLMVLYSEKWNGLNTFIQEKNMDKRWRRTCEHEGQLHNIGPLSKSQANVKSQNQHNDVP